MVVEANMNQLLVESQKILTVNSFISRDELLQQTNHIPFALVSLSPKITVEGFPGKTFDYLKMNKILNWIFKSKSSLAKFIEKYKLGINISSK